MQKSADGNHCESPVLDFIDLESLKGGLGLSETQRIECKVPWLTGRVKCDHLYEGWGSNDYFPERGPDENLVETSLLHTPVVDPSCQLGGFLVPGEYVIFWDQHAQHGEHTDAAWVRG